MRNPSENPVTSLASAGTFPGRLRCKQNQLEELTKFNRFRFARADAQRPEGFRWPYSNPREMEGRLKKW